MFLIHCANMPMYKYTAIFHGCKNDNFQKKTHDIFLIFAQNIDFGYTFEPTIYVLEQNKKKKYVYPCEPEVYYINVGCKRGINHTDVLS